LVRGGLAILRPQGFLAAYPALTHLGYFYAVAARFGRQPGLLFDPGHAAALQFGEMVDEAVGVAGASEFLDFSKKR
jgi:hypothetical protein